MLHQFYLKQRDTVQVARDEELNKLIDVHSIICEIQTTDFVSEEMGGT